MSERKWNKYFAYTGDVANYNIEYEDFEEAKHGALVSASFAAMVLKNDTKFPDYVCKSAVSNLLINGIENEYLSEEYEPFVLSGYSTPNFKQDCYGEHLWWHYGRMRYCVGLTALLQNDGYYDVLKKEYGFQVKYDIDIARFALYNGQKEIFEEELEYAKKQGYFENHFDFENDVYDSSRANVPIEEVYEPLPHHPLLSFEEVSVVDILASEDLVM